jgi:hypothetical protein
MAFHLARLSIADIVTSGKGGKSAPIASDGCPAVATLAPMRVAFEPSAYNDAEASRVNIVFRPSAEVLSELEELDEWVLSTVSEQAPRFFNGKAKTVSQLREIYTPVVKHSEKYESTFKAKMNLRPPAQVKIWDSEKQARDPPAQFKDCMAAPRQRLRGLYFMGAQFGCVIECTDLQILEEEASGECPF